MRSQKPEQSLCTKFLENRYHGRRAAKTSPQRPQHLSAKLPVTLVSRITIASSVRKTSPIPLGTSSRTYVSRTTLRTSQCGEHRLSQFLRPKSGRINLSTLSSNRLLDWPSQRAIHLHSLRNTLHACKDLPFLRLDEVPLDECF